MRILAGYDEKDLTEDRELDAFERYSIGTVDRDGLLTPHNEPVLWKKERVAMSTTTGDTFEIKNIQTWLDVPAADLKHYYVDVYLYVDQTDDAIYSDNFTLSMYDGSAASYELRAIIEFGGSKYGYEPTRMYPSEGYPVLRGDFSSWGAVETHKGSAVLMAYRMPEGIST